MLLLGTFGVEELLEVYPAPDDTLIRIAVESTIRREHIICLVFSVLKIRYLGFTEPLRENKASKPDFLRVIRLADVLWHIYKWKWCQIQFNKKFNLPAFYFALEYSAKVFTVLKIIQFAFVA